MKETFEKTPKKETAKGLRGEIEKLSQSIKNLRKDGDLKDYFELQEKLNNTRNQQEYQKIVKEMELLFLEKKLGYKQKSNNVQVNYIEDIIEQEKKLEIDLERLERELKLKEKQEELEKIIFDVEKLKRTTESNYQKLLGLEEDTDKPQITEIEKQIQAQEVQLEELRNKIEPIIRKMEQSIDREHAYLENVLGGHVVGAVHYGKDILIEKEKNLIWGMIDELKSAKEKIVILYPETKTS